MYLCHSENLMPKDTKSLGNNKAPACESRGFGHKKEGENFDTPSVDFLCVMDTVSNGTHILYPVHIRTDTSCLILEILHANYFL